MLLSNVLALLGPKLSGKAIDAIGIRAGGVDFEKVFYYVGWMAVFYVFSAFFSYLLRRIYSYFLYLQVPQFLCLRRPLCRK